MRRSIFVLMGQFTLAAGVAAQVTPGHVGIGVGINNGLEIRLPVSLSRRWRLEPAVGLTDQKVTGTTSLSASTDPSRESSDRAWRLSILLARVVSLDSAVSVYLGPRVGVSRTSQSRDFAFGSAPPNLISWRQVSPQFGLVTGAEFFLTRHFSIGGEVNLTETFNGPVTVSPSPLPQNVVLGLQTGGHTLRTGAEAVVRWFFGKTA